MDNCKLVTSLLAFLTFASGLCSSSEELPKLLLMSFDSFRWNFIEKLPKSSQHNFTKFMANGVRAKWIENVFPTVTNPNHLSMVTGLYPENHGVVHNHFYDPVLKRESPDRPYGADDTHWLDPRAEPIWVTNSKAGGGRHSGSVMFPLSGVPVQGMLPERLQPENWHVLEDNVTATQRIDMALNWLTDQVNPVNFVAAYFPDTDHFSHVFGPDSQEVLDSVRDRDNLIGYLLHKMDEKGLTGVLNVIITGDHGQVPVYDVTEINLDLLVLRNWYKAYPAPSAKGSETAIHMWPTEDKDAKDNLLQHLKHDHMHVEVRGQSEALQELHYDSNPRIAPIVIMADLGYVFTTNETPSWALKGQHGYDPRTNVNMYPFFLATGPAFKKGLPSVAHPFHMVDIYPLMCHILDLQPAPNNGTLDNVRHILAEGSTNMSYVAVFIGIAVVVLSLVVSLIVCKKMRKSKNITNSYKNTYSRATTKDKLVENPGLVNSDDEL